MRAGLWPARGQGTLVALGFPIMALLVLGLWVGQQGAGIETSVPAAVVLVGLAALAEQINVVVSRRTATSAGGAFVVAAALVGGPLLGACAGMSLEAFTTGHRWRPRAAYGGANAFGGFLVGLVGDQLVLRGPGGSLALAFVGLLVGYVWNTVATGVVALDRKVDLRSEFSATWRSTVCAWFAPAPVLAAFLFLSRNELALALGLATGLLLVATLANRLRLRLERSLEEERSRARLDALTGAPNRYALAEALAVEQGRINRGGHSAALCFLDLDLFREVNNTWGYAAGDQLLVDVYQRLRDLLRASDQTFRWGGEEFVVLAPRVERGELSEFAERLRLSISSDPFSVDDSPRTITASVGAVLLDDSRPVEDALEAASRLVRRAKLTRNTTVVETAPALSTAGAGITAAAVDHAPA